MDSNLKKYMENGEYLPDFMRDFHNQKLLFKRIDEINKRRNDDYTKEIDWISAHVYTVDLFLWYMACHGYTLQKSRKKVSFYDIYDNLNNFEERKRKESGEILTQIIKQQKEASANRVR